MTQSRERIEAEFESIERVLSVLMTSQRAGSVPLSPLEIAGVGALLHDFYSGVENLLKQACRKGGGSIPVGPAWHRDLLDSAVALGIISPETAERLRPYLAFRHFFAHGYSLDLDLGRIGPLLRNVSDVWRAFRQDIARVEARPD